MPLHPEPSRESPVKPELTEAQKQAREILERDYGHFSHQRLVEGMGLSPEEADEFVVELIHQLEGAINDLDAAVSEKRYEEVEHITHGLKGAALNIGEGGVAQLLVDYNTYMKHGTEQPVIEAYQTLLKRTVSDLKVEYSQVA
jgi:HPt (histidine-containing phosphotransfer) domain-containing protein